MQYNSQIDKLDHKISCETSLKLNNVKYNLIGIVVHLGNTAKVRHYYTITRCWETGIAYKLNDSDFTEMFKDNNDIVTEIEKAYMLVFSKTSNETDAMLTRTNEPMEEHHSQSEVTT